MTKVKENRGGRPKLADYQKRTKLVRIMFCENDFIYIQSKASKAGLSVSEYCHQAAMDNHIRETISPELAKQIRDLSGTANNVNQIAHQIHIDGFDAVKEQCLHIIAAISNIINQVITKNYHFLRTYTIPAFIWASIVFMSIPNRIIYSLIILLFSLSVIRLLL